MGIGMSSAAVQQLRHLFFAQLGLKGLTAPEASVGNLPPIGADTIPHRCVHCSPVDNNRFVIALIKHRHIDRFARLFR
ncbi:hypothetical protein ACLB1N_22610 [Escherichia coli]